jgi:hypothetical protein
MAAGVVMIEIARVKITDASPASFWPAAFAPSP